MVAIAPHQAFAIPSFAAQTGQPCSACHVGAFGPQLTPFGRDFKTGGYVASDRKKDNIVDNWYERFTVMAQGSFTNTQKDQAPGSVPSGYGPNNNFSLDQVSGYFGGRITPSIGAFQEISYDGTQNAVFWDALDVRHVWEGTLLGDDYTGGITLGNQLGETSAWNSTPPNTFPYNTSRLMPTPQGTLLDDTLNGQLLGPGVYYSGDWIYAEGDAYFPLSQNIDQAVGNTASDKYTTPIPYWHLAVQHDFDHHNHYAQLGTFGATAVRQPGKDQTSGLTDRLTDLGLEANYQYLADMHNIISTHATYIRENQNLQASQALFGTNLNDHINEFKADVTYSLNDTYVPTLQYFKTTGSRDSALYGGQNNQGDYINSVNGSPNSEGYTVDLAYVPFGKPDSPASTWANMRLAVQYTGYTQFNGTAKGASDNNTIFLNLWLIGAPLVPAFSK
jgi:hypothetical protein